MPPKTRKSGGPTSAAAQRTLSFNNKSAKVTKHSASQDASLSAKRSKSKLSEPAQDEIVEATSIPPPEAENEAEAESDIRPDSNEVKAEDQTQIKTTTPPKRKSRRPLHSTTDSRAKAAEKITDAQIKKYWQGEESARLAPRVHQQTVPLHEKILRHFDLSSQYGPCIGTPRLQRWKRANALGLDPPVEVLAVLMREEGKSERDRRCGTLAYIDELSGGRVVLVE